MIEPKKPVVFTLPLELTPAQQHIDSSTARFKVIKAGRRFGKSLYSLYWLLKQAAKPNTNNWFVGPTYNQVKEVAWQRLLSLIPPVLIKGQNQTELSVTLINHSMIFLKGSDQENHLRGRKIDASVMEEAAFQKPTIWQEILRPSLADTMGPCLFISTPRGINWF